MRSKHIIYISLFVLLGILLQLVAHAVLEIWYIDLLLSDFQRYGFGLTWEAWVQIHSVLSFVFLVFGMLFGYQQGKHWWRKIYIEHAYRWTKKI